MWKRRNCDSLRASNIQLVSYHSPLLKLEWALFTTSKLSGFSSDKHRPFVRSWCEKRKIEWMLALCRPYNGIYQCWLSWKWENRENLCRAVLTMVHTSFGSCYNSVLRLTLADEAANNLCSLSNTRAFVNSVTITNRLRIAKQVKHELKRAFPSDELNQNLVKLL